jgi:hypothetical protein
MYLVCNSSDMIVEDVVRAADTDPHLVLRTAMTAPVWRGGHVVVPGDAAQRTADIVLPRCN